MINILNHIILIVKQEHEVELVNANLIFVCDIFEIWLILLEIVM